MTTQALAQAHAPTPISAADKTAAPGSGVPALTPGLKRISSQNLLGPLHELVIDHNGREYRLRLTQNGKLILTA